MQESMQPPRSQVGMRFIGSFLKFALIALLIATPFRFFVAQPFIVSGASMTPTLDQGEYLVIDEITYRFEKPQRGDIVIFRYPLDTDIFFIKRVVGLPGESLEIKDGLVSIQASSGEEITLMEPYRSSDAKEARATSIQLAADEYFVLGDNRGASADSRVWGPLQDRYIVGRAFARLLPLDSMSLFPGKYSFE